MKSRIPYQNPAVSLDTFFEEEEEEEEGQEPSEMSYRFKRELPLVKIKHTLFTFWPRSTKGFRRK